MHRLGLRLAPARLRLSAAGRLRRGFAYVAAYALKQPFEQMCIRDSGMDCANLAEYTTKLMIERGVTVAAAESCTGGEFTKAITDIPGASSALLGGVVVYTNEAKHKLLGVPQELLDTKGAVSFEVAVELARRVREKLGSTFGVGITGLAGPDGDGVHEVGTVFISLADGENVWVREKHITQRERAQVRLYACQNAFDMIRRRLDGCDVGEIRVDP